MQACVIARVAAAGATATAVARSATRKQRLIQVSVGLNVALLAVGLPVAWNTVVADKWAQWRDRRDLTLQARVQRAHELAAQALVNERRRERGESPLHFVAAAASPLDVRGGAVSGEDSVTFEVERVIRRDGLARLPLMQVAAAAATGREAAAAAEAAAYR